MLESCFDSRAESKTFLTSQKPVGWTRKKDQVKKWITVICLGSYTPLKDVLFFPRVCFLYSWNWARVCTVMLVTAVVPFARHGKSLTFNVLSTLSKK